MALMNQEWQLGELVEWCSAELDSVTDTLTLKSQLRGAAFGPTSFTLNLNVFLRFDARLQKFLFRTAEPGEVGATTVQLEMAMLLRDQLEVNGRLLTICTAPLKDLHNISPLQALALNKLGVFTVGDLRAVCSTPERRALVASKTSVPMAQIAMWLSLPYIMNVKVNRRSLLVAGERFAPNGARGELLVDGLPIEVLHWSDESLEAVRQPDFGIHCRFQVLTPRGASNEFAAVRR